MDSSVIEIRKIKYSDYVDKHPDKPYGYYALGELELMSSSYEKAMIYFTKALSLDPGFDRASIGYILCLIQENKLMQAIRHLYKNGKNILKKKILMQDLIHGLCSSLPLTDPDLNIPMDCKTVDLTGMVGRVIWHYKRKRNIVAGVMLALHFMSNPSRRYESFKVLLYSDLVIMPGIIESLRWNMVSDLAVHYPEVLQDRLIASMFRYIPSNDMTPEYANTVFSTALTGQKKDLVGQIRRSADYAMIPLTQDNKWHYVYTAYMNKTYDKSVMQDCVFLIRSGWIDPTVAGALKDMILLKMEGYTKRDLERIQLFGFEFDESRTAQGSGQIL